MSKAPHRSVDVTIIAREIVSRVDAAAAHDDDGQGIVAAFQPVYGTCGPCITCTRATLFLAALRT